MSNNSTTSISQARKAVEQLKMEACMDRVKVSTASHPAAHTLPTMALCVQRPPAEHPPKLGGQACPRAQVMHSKHERCEGPPEVRSVPAVPLSCAVMPVSEKELHNEVSRGFPPRSSNSEVRHLWML